MRLMWTVLMVFITIFHQGNSKTLDCGICIYCDENGNFHILCSGDIGVKKLLEVANRFCTRWVRLDI